MSQAFVALGSNLGDRRALLRAALGSLAALRRTRLAVRSCLRPSDPVGGPPQPAFLNGAARVETSLGPSDLLRALQAVERRLGRRRGIRWGPRTVDLDLLLYEGFSQTRPELTIPHPLLAKRAFVLRPLAEIAPALRLPDGRTPGEALAALVAEGADGASG